MKTNKSDRAYWGVQEIPVTVVDRSNNWALISYGNRSMRVPVGSLKTQRTKKDKAADGIDVAKCQNASEYLAEADRFGVLAVVKSVITNAYDHFGGDNPGFASMVSRNAIKSAVKHHRLE